MLACQMKVRADGELAVYLPCNRPDTALMRVSCPRRGHVEEVVMCKRCLAAVTYCQRCFDEDRLLVKSAKLVVMR